MKLLITTQAVDKNDPILGFFHNWLKEFSKHFEVIHVICLREGVHELPQNVHVHSLGKEGGVNRIKYLVLFYKHFYTIFVREHVDIVFFHMGAIYNILATPFFLLRKLKNTKFIWWKTHGVLNLVGRVAFICVDEVVTAGSASFGIVSPKVRVVGHAIDTDTFSEIDHTHADTHACLMVGRIVPIKKIEIALEIVNSITKKGGNISLTIVGSADSDEYQKKLQEYCGDNNLVSVNFVGPCSHANIGRYYAQASVLLHPAFDAGFDKVILEAMLSGVIPLTSIQSFEPLLERFGLFIPADDVTGYVTALGRIFSLSTEERSKLAHKLACVAQTHSLKTLPKRIFGV